MVPQGTEAPGGVDEAPDGAAVCILVGQANPDYSNSYYKGI